MKRKYKDAFAAGVGNIGSHFLPLVARSPHLERLAIADPDVVESRNATSQQFQPEDVGRPKVDVMKDTLRTIRPDLEVIAIHGEAEDCPIAFFMFLVICCLDSDGPRQVCAARTRQAGGVLFDLAVNASAGLVRITEVPPQSTAACLECGWSAEYDHLPVRHRCGRTPRTGASAALGSLVGSLAALRIEKLRENPSPLATTEIVASHEALWKSAMPRNPDCRFSHAPPIHIEVLSDFDGDQTLGSLFDRLQCEQLELPDFLWDRRIRCSECGYERDTLRVGRARIAECCGGCGHPMERLGFYSVPTIRKGSQADHLLARSLREVELQPGDVVIPDRAPQAMQLGDPFRMLASHPTSSFAL